MSGVDRSIPVPLYYQLKELLREQISAGHLKPGDRLPTEDELCEQFGISRTPVRQALAELVHDGLLVRIPARGTFVVERVVRPEAAGLGAIRAVLPDDRWRQPLQSAAEQWNSEHPDDPIDLNFQMVAHAELRSTLIAAVGKGEAPDISVLDSVWVAEFAHQHYLQPLDEVDPDWLQLNGAGFFPVALEANRYQGRLYALPITADVSVLWYRKDWLAAEGFSPPSTWDEMVAIGRHFQEARVRRRYGLGPHPLVFVAGKAGGETTTHQLLPLLWSAGGDLICDRQVVLDSPEARRALTFLRALVQELGLAPPEVVDYTWNQAVRVFAQGKAVLALGGSYESFFIQHIAGWNGTQFQERVGFTPIPAAPGRQPAVLAGGMSYVLYRQSRKPKGAMALLNMMGQTELLKPFCMGTGHIPPLRATAQEMRSQGNSFVARTIPLLEIARARPVTPDYARVSAQFQAMMEECVGGRREIGEILALASERISAITGFPIARRAGDA